MFPDPNHALCVLSPSPETRDFGTKTCFDAPPNQAGKKIPVPSSSTEAVCPKVGLLANLSPQSNGVLRVAGKKLISYQARSALIPEFLQTLCQALGAARPLSAEGRRLY